MRTSSLWKDETIRLWGKKGLKGTSLYQSSHVKEQIRHSLRYLSCVNRYQNKRYGASDTNIARNRHFVPLLVRRAHQLLNKGLIQQRRKTYHKGPLHLLSLSHCSRRSEKRGCSTIRRRSGSTRKNGWSGAFVGLIGTDSMEWSWIPLLPGFFSESSGGQSKHIRGNLVSWCHSLSRMPYPDESDLHLSFGSTNFIFIREAGSRDLPLSFPF
mgnify:CR=1 FL=1